jgi:hypothetical protein
LRASVQKRWVSTTTPAAFGPSSTDQAADHGTESHHVEVGTADHTGTDDARFAETDHREADRRELAERADRLHPFAKVLNLGHREDGVVDVDARRALTDVDQPVLIAVDERLEQHSAYDAEDRGVGADAERQRQHDRDRQPLDSPERAERHPKIGHEISHGERSFARWALD